MSVIIQEKDQYYLYVKGADNKMLTQIIWKNNNDREILEDHLRHFAIQGLRTLVMGRRKLSNSDFENIMSGIRKIQSSESRNKDEQYTEIYVKYEKDLEFLGASAIEDKLQDNVPQTISKLMEANIRVWVLTGDKQETAKEIARSCQLIQDSMKVIELTVEMKDLKPEPNESPKAFEQRQKEATEEYVRILTKNLTESKEQYIDKDTDINTEEQIFKTPLKDLTKRGKPLTIVIDGPTLALILGNTDLEKLFLCIGLFTKSVVCCRVSPKQKSMVVALVKKYKKGVIRLSIGDGANDVPMIMEANIGVGIRGKEGTQAVRSADYAISQFQYLQKLIMFHGRLGYRRVSWVICYYFYKNIVLVFTEIYFAFYNGFSGQIYFADWLPMLYNSLWTSLTCLFAYALERDVTYAVTLLHPKLYEAGQKKEYFSYLIFWKWVGLAALHGIIIFFSCSFGFRGVIDSDGKTEDMWFASTIAFSVIIHLVTGKLAIELIYLNWIVLAAGIGSVFFYWAFVIIFNTSAISQTFQPELEYVYFRMFANLKFWIVIILLPFIVLLPDMTIKYFKQLYWPSVSDKVVAEEYNRKKSFIKS